MARNASRGRRRRRWRGEQEVKVRNVGPRVRLRGRRASSHRSLKSNQHHTARGKSSLATMESSEYCLVKGRWGNKEIYLAHALISTYLSIRSNGLKQSRRRRYGDTYPSSNSANWHPPHHTDFTETSPTPLLLLHSNHSSHRPRRSDHTTGGNNGASGP